MSVTAEEKRRQNAASLKKWRNANPERAHAIAKRCRTRHQASDSLRLKRWRNNNRSRNNASYKRWLNADVRRRLAARMRTRIAWAVRHGTKAAPTLKLLGCSIEELKQHLEAQFKPGMSWSNYGLWHVDHRRPCAAFDLALPAQQEKCFHYTNLQPMWGIENIRKGDKV
jgi:hypothetical protein